MNATEFGTAIRVGVGYDISGFSTLSLVFTKPSGATLTVTDSSSPAVSAPSSAASDFLANQYFEYTTADGDIDEAGTWEVCAIYVDGQKKLVSDKAKFYVAPAC